MVSFFNNIISKGVIKYSYDADKFMTMSSFSLKPPNKQVYLQAPWSCWRVPTSRHLLTFYTWKTCGNSRGCWTKFLSCECCKGFFTPPRVLCNSWCVHVGCPPSWGQWWTLHSFHVFGIPLTFWYSHWNVEHPKISLVMSSLFVSIGSQ